MGNFDQNMCVGGKVKTKELFLKCFCGTQNCITDNENGELFRCLKITIESAHSLHSNRVDIVYQQMALQL